MATPEEISMWARGLSSKSHNDPVLDARFDAMAWQLLATAELTERLDTQNTLLARIAAALEGGK